MYEFGVVGCGVIGTRLAETLADHPDATVRAACDTDADRVEEFADTYDCVAHRDHTDLVGDDSVDVVYVGVPPVGHVPVGTDALAAGKHLLCEKPIAPTATGGETLVDAAAETDRVAGVNLPFRYTPGFRELRRRVSDGDVGEVRRVDLRFRFPRWPREWQDVAWLESREQGGPIREVGTHFLFGVDETFGPVERLTAETQYDGPERHETSVVGSFAVDGVHGTLDLATGVADDEENSITVLGTEGKLTLTDWHRLVADRGRESERVLVDDRAPTTRRLLDEFVAELDGDDGDLVSLSTATRIQRVVDAVFASDGESVALE
ncbi:Gfo/Idh/MocA family protein [Halobaculum sp. MBLA0143]|uniref:Gfo/Idh/MocA family protein n=1 Tax=Halobaculum sp. MBLA0143 TaxID=3079933 RepID=UPI0035260826